MADPVRLIELRVLEGPNLYFTRPAIKLTLAVPGWLTASDERILAIAERLGVPGGARTGPPESEQRRRVVARMAAFLTRRIAVAGGARRLAVRARPGHERDQIVVAFPWRRRAAAEALGNEVAAGMTSLLRRSPDRLIAEAGRRLVAVEPGDVPAVPDPSIPVVQVTGTNGKTTTVRLLAHLVRSAGKTVAYSSTDGVFRDDGSLIESGDYSGFGGAARALAQEPDVAVLETARGGMLLRGVGVRHNDVAVVTNVTEDHLGLHGVDTVDQLAEVKSVITRITRPQGWDVLNADDPRVLAMRRHATGRPWLFSLDPHHPAIREALGDGGRGMTVLDGHLAWVDRHETHPLASIVDIPVTLAGISRPNLQNAMAAAAAGLAIGLPERAVVKGLEDVRLGSRTQSRAGEPVPDRSAPRRDRLRAQRGRHDRPDGGAGRPQGRRPRGVAGDLHGRRPHRPYPPRVRVPGGRRFGSPGDRGADALPPRPIPGGHHRTAPRGRARSRRERRADVRGRAGRACGR